MSVYQVYNNKKNNFLSRMSVNSILISVNIFLFIIFTILISLGVLSVENVAIKPANILAGKYLWTFVTSMFMHGGFFHLFANMLSLFFVGSLVEKLVGRKRYFLFYMISGIFAGLIFVLAGLLFGLDLNTYAVGASGALFGLVGLLVLLTPNLSVYVMFIPIPIKMKYAAPGILLLLWLISIAGNVPIGNVAHLGGLIAGLLYGIYLRQKYPRKSAMIRQRFS